MNDLSIGDGFKFGCGFFLAGAVAWVIMTIIGGILALIFGGAITALFGDMGADLFGMVLPLLMVL